MKRLPFAVELSAVIVGAVLLSTLWIVAATSGKPATVAVAPPAATRTTAPVVAVPTERPSVRVADSAPTAAPVVTATALPTQAPLREAKPEAKPKVSEQSPEVLLAIIQHGQNIQPSDPRVVPFARQLDRLGVKCSEERRKLADLTAGANKVMGDRGTREPILNTVYGVATASEGLPTRQACESLFTGYAAGRLSGIPGAAPP